MMTALPLASASETTIQMEMYVKQILRFPYFWFSVMILSCALILPISQLITHRA